MTAPRRSLLRASFAVATPLLLGALACATGPSDTDHWHSGVASLTLTDSTSTLNLLAPGDCIGSFGTLATRPGSGAFDVPGTYTQLIGAYPGFVVHPARFAGSVSAKQVSVTIAVADMGTVLGPFVLTAGRAPLWDTCRYP